MNFLARAPLLPPPSMRLLLLLLLVLAEKVGPFGVAASSAAHAFGVSAEKQEPVAHAFGSQDDNAAALFLLLRPVTAAYEEAQARIDSLHAAAEGSLLAAAAQLRAREARVAELEEALLHARAQVRSRERAGTDGLAGTSNDEQGGQIHLRTSLNSKAQHRDVVSRPSPFVPCLFLHTQKLIDPDCCAARLPPPPCPLTR